MRVLGGATRIRHLGRNLRDAEGALALPQVLDAGGAHPKRALMSATMGCTPPP